MDQRTLFDAGPAVKRKRPWRYKGGRKAAQERSRKKHRERRNARKRELYALSPEKGRARSRVYRSNNAEKCFKINTAWQRKRLKKIRAEFIAAYGGCCACCGESEPLFLQLDHIHNDGAQERRELGNNFVVLLRLKDRGWPKDNHQILCANCNHGKRMNGGICPHKKE
jgi:hypothetical protein